MLASSNFGFGVTLLGAMFYGSFPLVYTLLFRLALWLWGFKGSRSWVGFLLLEVTCVALLCLVNEYELHLGRYIPRALLVPFAWNAVVVISICHVFLMRQHTIWAGRILWGLTIAHSGFLAWAIDDIT